MAPDRRALFDAAYGALMIRSAPAKPAAAESPKTLSSANLKEGAEAAARTRS